MNETIDITNISQTSTNTDLGLSTNEPVCDKPVCDNPVCDKPVLEIPCDKPCDNQDAKSETTSKSSVNSSKKQMSEKQLAALKEGRAKLAEKRRLLKLQKEQEEQKQKEAAIYDSGDEYDAESDDEHGSMSRTFCSIL